jgi:hypothetical protein
MSPRIAVTCSRSWSAWSTLRTALEKVHAEHPDAVLVHGDAPRGDRQAAGIWRHLGGEVEAWPAKWDEHGDDCKCLRSNPTCRFAGYRRNIAMVESGVDMVVAFIRDGSPGASHCAKYAEDAGIPVVRYEQEGA